MYVRFDPRNWNVVGALETCFPGAVANSVTIVDAKVGCDGSTLGACCLADIADIGLETGAVTKADAAEGLEEEEVVELAAC